METLIGGEVSHVEEGPRDYSEVAREAILAGRAEEERGVEAVNVVVPVVGKDPLQPVA